MAMQIIKMASVQKYLHTAKASRKCRKQYPVRGYLSSVDNRLHFGFGNNVPDSIKIIWADGNMQVIQHPPIDTLYKCRL